MKRLFLILALALPAAAAAQPPSDATAETSGGGGANPNDRICRKIGETGSRLQRSRVCMTRAQWEARRRETRQDIDRAQSNRSTTGE